MQNARTTSQGPLGEDTSRTLVYSADGNPNSTRNFDSHAMKGVRRRQRAEKEHAKRQGDFIFARNARPLAVLSGDCLRVFESVLTHLREWAQVTSSKSQPALGEIEPVTVSPTVQRIAKEHLAVVHRQYHTFRLWHEGMELGTGEVDQSIKHNSRLLSSVVSFLVDLGRLLCAIPTVLELDLLRTCLDCTSLNACTLEAAKSLRGHVPPKTSNPAVELDSSDTSDSLDDDDLADVTAGDFDDELVTKVECLCELGPALQRLAHCVKELHHPPKESVGLGNTLEPEATSRWLAQDAIPARLESARPHLEDYWILRYHEMQQKSANRGHYTVGFNPDLAQKYLATGTLNSDSHLPQDATSEELALYSWLEMVDEAQYSDPHGRLHPIGLLEVRTGTSLSHKSSVRSTTSTRTQESGYYSNLAQEYDPMPILDEEKDGDGQDTFNIADAEQASKEALYCYCNQAPCGEMIACDHVRCTKEWFHLGCTELMKIPSQHEEWYCTDCRLLDVTSREDVGIKEETSVDDNLKCSSCGAIRTPSDLAGNHASDGNGPVCFHCLMTKPETQLAIFKMEGARTDVRDEQELGEGVKSESTPVKLESSEQTAGDFKVAKPDVGSASTIFPWVVGGHQSSTREPAHKPNFKQRVLAKHKKWQKKWNLTPGPENANLKECPVSACRHHLNGFTDKEERDRHIIMHFDDMQECLFCPPSVVPGGNSFKGLESMKAHLVSKHGIYPKLLETESLEISSDRNAPISSIVETYDERRPWSGNLATKRPPVRTTGLVPPSAATVTRSGNSSALNDLDTANTRDLGSNQRAATCFICQCIFAGAQKFYDHLDQCVVRYLKRIDFEPSQDWANLKPSQRSKVVQERAKVNIRCLTCRKRKVNCDGERPACSTCTRNKIQCSGYDQRVLKVPGPEAASYKSRSVVNMQGSSQAGYDDGIGAMDLGENGPPQSSTESR